MSAINGFSSQISSLSLALEPVGNSQTKDVEPLVISIDPQDLKITLDKNSPRTIQVSSKDTEIQIFKKFGFDVKDENELAALKQRLGGRDPFAYVLSDPNGYTAKLENGKYVIRTRIDTALRKELQGVAAQVKTETQNNNGTGDNPNTKGAAKAGIDEGARRRAELERKFPDIPNVVTLPPNPNNRIDKQAEAGLKVLQQLGEHLAKNPPTAEEALDALQTALDLIGIVDPTPISDGSSAVISAMRGEYGYAAISVVAAVIPYLGDFAKLAKLPRFIKVAEKSLDYVKNAPKITKEMEVALEALSKQLDDIPTSGLPKAAKESIEGLKKQVDDVLEQSRTVAKSGDEVAEVAKEYKAKLGSTTSLDYKKTFFEANPTLKGKVWVHHAIEQDVLTKYKGVIKPEELHSLENLRGIPKDVNSDVHLSKIRLEWNKFYLDHPAKTKPPTKQELLDFATYIDKKYGHLFTPTVK